MWVIPELWPSLPARMSMFWVTFGFTCRRRSGIGLWNLSRVEGGEPRSDRVVAVRINWPVSRMIHYHRAESFSSWRSSRLHLQFHLLSCSVCGARPLSAPAEGERGQPPYTDFVLPPVSILKPLKGTDPDIYESFRSHCLQDYPEYEIIFGVSDAGDPAVASVEQLQREFPDRTIRLVVCSEHTRRECEGQQS